MLIMKWRMSKIDVARSRLIFRGPLHDVLIIDRECDRAKLQCGMGLSVNHVRRRSRALAPFALSSIARTVIVEFG